MSDILLELHIAATPDKVCEVITTQKGVKGWLGLTTFDTAKPERS